MHLSGPHISQCKPQRKSNECVAKLPHSSFCTVNPVAPKTSLFFLSFVISNNTMLCVCVWGCDVWGALNTKWHNILLGWYQRYGTPLIKWAAFCMPNPYVVLYELERKDMLIRGFYEERVREKAIERVIKREDEGRVLSTQLHQHLQMSLVFFLFSLLPQPSPVLLSPLAVCDYQGSRMKMRTFKGMQMLSVATSYHFSHSAKFYCTTTSIFL